MFGYNVEMNIFTVLFALIVTFVVMLMSTKFAKRKEGKARKLPPGDMGFPVVGSTFSFMKSHSPIDLGDYVNHQLSKHGKIFTTRILGKTTVISADPDLNKFVVQNESRMFQNEVPSHIRNVLGSKNLSFMAGDEYKLTKSVLVSFMNTWEIQTKYLEGVQKAAERIFRTWKEQDVLYLDEEAHKYAFNIIAEKVMGMNADEPETEQLRREFVTLHEGFFALPFNLPGTRYRKALQARKNMIKIVQKRVETKKKEWKNDTKSTDWIDWLLQNNFDESLEYICDSVIWFLFGGLVNSATSISLAIYFLSNCPKAVQRMREEHQEILREKKDGKLKLEWGDYRKMKFTLCVIKETLRMGNVTPNFWKKSIQDIDFKGYLIPKGTTFILHGAAMHLDPMVYEKPEYFDPWRWESINKTNNWMPFGGGLRYCNGSEHAKIEISIFLHHFLLNYNWEPMEPDHPISLPPVIFPKGLPIKIYPFDSRI